MLNIVQVVNGVTVLDQVQDGRGIPNGGVIISDTDYQGLANGLLVWNGTAAVPIVKNLDQVKAEQTQLIINAAQSALSVMTDGYPADEPLTWALQYAEATAYTASQNAKTPTLSAIATGAGATVSAIAAKVITKSNAYQAAAGAIVGKRQLKTAQIAAATDIATVRGIVW